MIDSGGRGKEDWQRKRRYEKGKKMRHTGRRKQWPRLQGGDGNDVEVHGEQCQQHNMENEAATVKRRGRERDR